MTCDEARRAFSDLYDGALSGAPLVALDRHLEGCPACRVEWGTFLQTVQALGELRGAEPAPGFAARIRGRMEVPTPWQRLVRALFLPLVVKVPIQAVALILVAFTAVMISQRSPEPKRQAVVPVAPGPTASRTPRPPSVQFRPQQPAVEEPKGTVGPEKDGHRGLGGRPAAPAPRAEPPVAGAPPVILQAAPPQPGATPAPPAPAPLRRDAKFADEAVGAGAEKFRGPAAEGKGLPGDAVATARRLRSAPASPGDVRAKAAEMAAPLAPPAPSSSAVLKTEAPAQAQEGRIASIPSGSADELYSAGLTEFARQDYGQAVGTFRAFLTQHPRDPRVPDARFWLADAYFVQQRYAEAIPEYEALIRQFPDSRRVPTAIFRQAQARLATGDPTGCAILRDMVDRYPRARENAQAREVLGTHCP